MREQRKHLPSPVKQQVLCSSSLEGMERPARSFKSFIRTFNPHQNLEEDKPLASSITSPTSAPSSSLEHSQHERLTRVSSWKAPADWDSASEPDSERKASPLLSTRDYSPLLPDPSPEMLRMQVKPRSRPCDLRSLQQALLVPLEDEQSDDAPPIPPRSTQRRTPPSTPPVNDIGGLIHSPVLPSPDGLPSVSSPNSCEDLFWGPDSQSTPCLRPSDMSRQIPTLSSKRYGLDPLRTEALLQGASLMTGGSVSPISPLGGHVAFSPWGTTPVQPEMDAEIDCVPTDHRNGEGLQYLSTSEGLHDILTYHHRYSKASIQPQHESESSEPVLSNHFGASAVPSRAPGLVPRPLSWIKNSTPAPHDEIRAHPTHTSESRTSLQKISSWIHVRHRCHSTQRPSTGSENDSCSTDASQIRPNAQILDSEVDLILKKEAQLPQFRPQIKGFRSRNKRAKTDSRRTALQTPVKTVEDPPRSSPDQFHSAPLLRLPGGFALVRQSPTSTQSLSSKLYADLPTPGVVQTDTVGNLGPSFGSNMKGRSSSLNSEDHQAQVAPTISINKAWRSSTSVPSSFKSAFKHSSPSPSSSPLSQELSRTPTPSTEPQSPLVEQGMSKKHKRSDSGTEEESSRHGISIRFLDRAKDRRDAWKRQQRDAKHEKLKQSIRLVGPTDSSGIAGYIKHDEKVSISEESTRNNLPVDVVGGNR